mmetsp:Transcript_51549/g.91759  ORF Transcript_51549/g.91759 Transcript_51549/m.91759 type:complete len:216 (+) Transcript_51549:111-758(+)
MIVRDVAIRVCTRNLICVCLVDPGRWTRKCCTHANLITTVILVVSLTHLTFAQQGRGVELEDCPIVADLVHAGSPHNAAKVSIIFGVAFPFRAKELRCIVAMNHVIGAIQAQAVGILDAALGEIVLGAVLVRTQPAVGIMEVLPMFRTFHHKANPLCHTTLGEINSLASSILTSHCCCLLVWYETVRTRVSITHCKFIATSFEVGFHALKTRAMD